MSQGGDQSLAAFSEFFDSFGVACGFLVPTATGLIKSVMDAPARLRVYFMKEGLHDYSSQPLGDLGKRRIPTWFVFADRLEETNTTLYRPSTNGDPRIWIRGLGGAEGYAQPGNVLAVFAVRGQLYVVNTAQPGLLATATHPTSPLGELLRKVASTHAAGGQKQQAASPVVKPILAPSEPADSGGRNNTDANQPSLVRLQKRAFGGEDVAVRPDAKDVDWWPKAPLLPGVSELIDDLSARVPSANGLNIYFLLGGAGNGKSFAARALAQRLGIGLEEDAHGLARRCYGKRCGDVDVVLLNDATIAPSASYEDRQEIALATDVDGWWSEAGNRPVVAFCCVNRGIIIDELRALAGTSVDVDEVSRAIMQWLADPESTALDKLDPADLSDESLKLGANCHVRCLSIQGRAIRLFSLAVDATSLFEMAGEDSDSRGLELMAQVLAKCSRDAAQRPELCPIRANVNQLSSSEGRGRWVELLAGAEVASGRLFSYRDIWGLITLSILGPRVQGRDESESTMSFVDACLDRFAQAGNDPWAKLEPLLSLSRFRLHNALFRAAIPSGKEAAADYPPSTPFSSGFAMLDPSAWGSSDSAVIEAAMEAISLGDRPSQALQQGSLLIGDAWSKFDETLEDALVAYVHSDACSDVFRRRLISWFGGYMLRLSCTASGALGNAEALKVWNASYAISANGPASLPLELERAINGLLFPSESDVSDQRLLIPAFAPRAEPVPVTRNGRMAILAESIDHSSLSLRVRRTHNRLVIDCLQASDQKVVGQLALDFPLVREALAWKKEKAGQTEATGFVEPRLERCRATSLGSLPSGRRRLVALVDGVFKELPL